ncbi:hypothetical protein NIES4071_12170 [Calothrix sp. NIES-4071]|nr:hypothetical protein NIES4071_12170 [Calothrix sp. NIES-4071]BAZ55557.1 hypothetical protein NIES4105_12130 [Calothrix sp. NIES-4105]
MILKDIVYFITKRLPEFISSKLQRQKKSETQKESESWIEDFDERERNSL